MALNYEVKVTETEARFYGALAETVARRAKADLFFLAKYVLGADRVKAGRDKFDWHHEELCRDLEKMAASRFNGDKRGYVVEWPRGTMKSTIGVVAFAIWRLLNEPNARILIDCQNATKATRYLKVIKGYFESAFFQELFGVLYDPRKDWNEERLCVLRTADGIKEPSIDVGGAEKDKTGMHYDYIISDDVSAETNSRTVEQIQKVINHVGQYNPLLDSDGVMVFCMTRWAFGDIGEWIEEENKTARQEARPEPFTINRKPAYKEDINGKFTQEIEFPLLHSRASLLHSLNLLKSYQFSCQYLLRPTSPSTAAFQRSWLKWIGEDCPDIPMFASPPGSTVYITVDTALAQKATSDYTAFVVSAIKPDFSIYILDVVRGHFTDLEIWNKLCELNECYKPIAVGVEAVFKMKQLYLFLKMQAQMNNKTLPWRELTTTAVSKTARIMGLQPFVQAGKFFMRRRVGDFVHLEDEMLKFDPRRVSAQTNDCLDAAAYITEMLNKPTDAKPPQFYNEEDWLEKLEAENKAAVKVGRPVKPVPSQSYVRMKMAHDAKARGGNSRGRVVPLSVGMRGEWDR